MKSLVTKAKSLFKKHRSDSAHENTTAEVLWNNNRVVVPHCNYIKSASVTSISSAGFIVSDSGKVYSMPGQNEQVVDQFEQVSIVHVSSGYTHTLFVTNSGACYILCTSYFSNYLAVNSMPVKIPQSEFNFERVVLTTCAAYTAIFFTENGNCYGMGSNQFGELGMPVLDTKQTIEKIKLPYNDISVVNADCGDHNLIFCDTLGRAFVTGYQPSSNMGFEEVDNLDGGNLKVVSHHQAIQDFIIQVSTVYYESAYLARNGNIYVSSAAASRLPNLKNESISHSETSLRKIKASEIERVYHTSITNIAMVCDGLYLFSKGGIVYNNIGMKGVINDVGSNYKHMEVRVVTMASCTCIYWTVPENNKYLERAFPRPFAKLYSDVVFV